MCDGRAGRDRRGASACRPFDHTDRVGQPRKIIVNEALVSVAWPGQDTIGRRLTVASQPVEVVGLARDTRFRALLTSAPMLPGWGLGWQQLRVGAESGVQHGGDVAGFSSLLTLLPARDGYG